MTSLAPIGGGRTLTSPDAVPARRIEERLEEIARELMTVTAMLRSAELRNQVCSAETVERAKQALTAATPEARQALGAACEPSTLVELGERIAALIQSVPQGDPANAYSAALTMDVGSLQPSRGALEAACRWLRTTAMFRPKIPEVLAAVREAGIMYKTALRAPPRCFGQRFQRCSPRFARLASCTKPPCARSMNCLDRSPEPSTPCGNAGTARNYCVGPGPNRHCRHAQKKPLPTEAMSGEPNDANASALVCSGCCTDAASPQAPPGGNALGPHSFRELRD